MIGRGPGRLIGLALVALAIAGCGPLERQITPRPDAPPPGPSKADILERAAQIAGQARPELSGAQVAPTNLQATRMTLRSALQQLDGAPPLPGGADPNTPVWLVTMDGLWLDEFPRPAGLPAPEPYRRYTIIINALTGAEIASKAGP